MQKTVTKKKLEIFRIEKVIKRKDDKLYVKWKGYDNSFNSCIDRKDIIIKKSKFTKKANLAGLKSDVNELDIDKFEKVPTGLNSLKTKVDKLDVDKFLQICFYKFKKIK